MDIALKLYFTGLALSAGLALWVMRSRQWSPLGLYVAFGCLFGAFARHETWLRMLFDPGYPVAAPSPDDFLFFPRSLAWGLLAAAIGFAELVAMVGALLRPRRLTALLLLLVASFQLMITAQGISTWIFSGALAPVTIGNIQVPAWIGLQIYLILYDLPFVCAVPFALSRLLHSGTAATNAILSRYAMAVGIILVSFLVLITSVLAATSHTARLAGSVSSSAQTFVGIALVSLLGILGWALYDFRRRFLDPAIALLEGISAPTDLRSRIPAGSLWTPIAESVQKSRDKASEHLEALESTARELDRSRAWFRAFVDNAPMPMSANLPDGTFLFANKASADFYGNTPEEMLSIDMSVARQNVPDFEEKVFQQANRTFETGIPRQSEIRVFSQQHGAMREVQYSFFPIHEEIDGRSQITQIGAICHDITDLREAQKQAAREQARFEAFFHSAPAAMYLTGPDDRIELVNDWVYKSYGLTEQDVIGAPSALFRPGSSARGERQIQQVVATGEPLSEEYEYALPVGTRIGECTLFAINDSDGNLRNIGGIVIDITERKEAEAQLFASRESLHQSEKLAALGQLLAGVAHEINNPLAAVLGQSSLLREDLEGSAHVARIDKIRRAAERCSRIVQSFLAMARQRPPNPGATAIKDLVEQALDLSDYQLRTAGIAVSCTLDPDLPPAMADANQVHQVIVNLLANARQALEQTEGERQIAISTHMAADRRMVELAISDNGPGVPAAIRSRIFDPFFTTKEEGQGTGFGLAYSFGIAQSHGGDLKLADSARGTCFILSLPVAETEVVPVETAAPAPRAKGRVLVVDDEKEVATTMAEMLARRGLDPVVALGGTAAITRLKRDPAFDLILSDLRMPRVDGAKLCAWIEANRPELRARLAFVTGDTLGDAAGRFLQGSGCPYIEKPFSAESLGALLVKLDL